MSTLHHLPSEGQIAKQLRQIFFSRGIRCPQCARRYDYKLQGRYFCKKCRLKFTRKRCTPFVHSKLSEKQLWFLLSAWLAQLSPQDTGRISGLSYPTIHRWFMRFSAFLPDLNPLLGGTVEIDEAFIGRKRFNNQTVVLGAIERQTGRVAVRAVPSREQGDSDRFILDHIKRASLICTDANPNYEHLPEFFGYGHEVCNHGMNHFGPTNRIENVWSRLWQFIRKVYHHVWKEHLPRLLNEFRARINTPEIFTSPFTFLSYVFQVS